MKAYYRYPRSEEAPMNKPTSYDTKRVGDTIAGLFCVLVIVLLFARKFGVFGPIVLE
jgi:hypothetical protein